MTTPDPATDPAIEAVTRALADNAITEGSDAMHSWRCGHPDIYPGYCTCIPELVADILTAVRPVIEAQALRDASEAWLHGAWGDTPRHADRVADRMGASQFAGDWLRERADRIEGDQ